MRAKDWIVVVHDKGSALFDRILSLPISASAIRFAQEKPKELLAFMKQTFNQGWIGFQRMFGILKQGTMLPGEVTVKPLPGSTPH
jgi:hypothetical protein